MFLESQIKVCRYCWMILLKTLKVIYLFFGWFVNWGGGVLSLVKFASQEFQDGNKMLNCQMKNVMPWRKFLDVRTYRDDIHMQ